MSRDEEFKGKKESCSCCKIRVVYTTDLCSECAQYKLKIEETVRLSTLEKVEKELENRKCFADGILSFTSWKYTKAKTKEEFQEAGLKVFYEEKEILKLIEELKQRGTNNEPR